MFVKYQIYIPNDSKLRCLVAYIGMDQLFVVFVEIFRCTS